MATDRLTKLQDAISSASSEVAEFGMCAPRLFAQLGDVESGVNLVDLAKDLEAEASVLGVSAEKLAAMSRNIVTSWIEHCLLVDVKENR